MELKLANNVKAAVEINGQNIINMENSVVYESIEDDEAFLYIKNNENIEIKIRIKKKE